MAFGRFEQRLDFALAHRMVRSGEGACGKSQQQFSSSKHVSPPSVVAYFPCLRLRGEPARRRESPYFRILTSLRLMSEILAKLARPLSIPSSVCSSSNATDPPRCPKDSSPQR